MYYVIQQVTGNPTKHYIAYKISRYITSSNSENVIMEFKHDLTVKRKWAPKGAIILITANEQIYKTAIENLDRIRTLYMEKIQSIKNQLDDEVNAMTNELQKEFTQIKQKSDI